MSGIETRKKQKFYISGYAVTYPYFVRAYSMASAIEIVKHSGMERKDIFLYPEKEFKEKWGKYIKSEYKW